jgi:hypothetical protein
VEVEESGVEEDAVAHGADDLADTSWSVVLLPLVFVLPRRPWQNLEQRLCERGGGQGGWVG